MSELITETPLSENTYITENKYTCWVKEKNNEYIPCLTTYPTLEPGKYKIKWNSSFGNYVFARESLVLDDLLELPNNTFREILSDINYFWDNRQLFTKYKFSYKRGILLYGNPGCGKSSIVALLSLQIIKKGGIVLSIQSYDDLNNYNNEFRKTFKTIQPNTPVLVIFEDLDALIRSSEAETMLLNVLDGMNQSSNIVNIGCTNYPENLKERILNRPSRFDKRYYFGLPDALNRKFYFENKILPEDIEKSGGESFINDLVSKTEGLSLAHLGELIKSIFIFKNTLEDTLSILRGMEKTISSSRNDGTKSVGFTNKVLIR